MNNTTQRIISAVVLIFILFLFSLFGNVGIKVFILLCGILLVDETVSKMLGTSRKHLYYIVSQVSFIAGFVFFNFIDQDRSYFLHFTNGAIVLNIGLLLYLYLVKMDSLKVVNSLKEYSFSIGALLLLPFLSISYLLYKDNWMLWVIFLLVFNFSVDTGAWFFGRRFGRTKLWPSISPKKTREGALGGSLFATLIACSISYFYFQNLSLLLVLLFFVMSVMAQLGDLVESKFKRQLGIKDSSNLIPGHGGIYDRIDSLIYVAPLFVFVVMYFY